MRGVDLSDIPAVRLVYNPGPINAYGALDAAVRLSGCPAVRLSGWPIILKGIGR